MKNNNDCLISIIVAAYQAEEYLNECLDSILKQNIDNWECIVIDDGSTDNTFNLAMDYVNKDFRFRAFKIDNSGPSKARNYGVSNSVGTYILPLDSDDYISDNYCQMCLEQFNVVPSLTVVYGCVMNFGTVNEFQFDRNNFEYRQQLLSNKIHVSGVFRKKDFEIVSGYDENMIDGYEDWEFYIRLLKNGGKILQVKGATLYYRRKQISRNENLERKFLVKRKVENYIFHKNDDIYERYFGSAISALLSNSKLLNPDEYYSYKDLIKIFKAKLHRTLKKYLFKN